MRQDKEFFSSIEVLFESADQVSVHLHKLMWEPHFYLSKYIVPAAKRVGADLLEFAEPEIAETVSGRKVFKMAAKRQWLWGDKLSENS